MKIEDILKGITPEIRRREIEKTQQTRLPKDLQEWVDGYKEIGGNRNDFIWVWVYSVSIVITLSCIEGKYKESLYKVKFLLIMFVVLVDDIADKHKDNNVLQELLKIPFDQANIKFEKLDLKERKYIKFTIKIWNYIENVFKNFPRHSEFGEIIKFDIKQLLNSMEYSCLVNKNKYLINSSEYSMYLSHNMQLIVDIMFDLCCSLKFEKRELGLIRKVILYAQYMTRIGNWITTWEREIKEDDFTSGVFAYAVEKKIISIEDLDKKNIIKLVEKIKKSKAERYFLEEWEYNYQLIKKMRSKIKTVEVNDFLLFLEKVIFAHFISRGYK